MKVAFMMTGKDKQKIAAIVKRSSPEQRERFLEIMAEKGDVRAEKLLERIEGNSQKESY